MGSQRVRHNWAHMNISQVWGCKPFPLDIFKLSSPPHPNSLLQEPGWWWPQHVPLYVPGVQWLRHFICHGVMCFSDTPMGVLFNNILKHRSLCCAQNLMESSSLLRLVPALHTGPAGWANVPHSPQENLSFQQPPWGPGRQGAVGRGACRENQVGGFKNFLRNFS